MRVEERGALVTSDGWHRKRRQTVSLANHHFTDVILSFLLDCTDFEHFMSFSSPSPPVTDL